MKNKWLLFFLAISFWAVPAVAAIENSDCFSCHEENEVRLEKFQESVHGDLNCTDCHAELATSDFPHETPLKPVECGSCHAEEQKQFSDSLHGKAFERGDSLAPRCQN